MSTISIGARTKQRIEPKIIIKIDFFFIHNIFPFLMKKISEDCTSCHEVVTVCFTS